MPAAWEALNKALDEALDLDASEHDAYFERLRATDPALAAEVQQLLAARRHPRFDEFLAGAFPTPVDPQGDSGIIRRRTGAPRIRPGDGEDEFTHLEASAEDMAGVSASGLPAGARVGPYELIRLLGAGGMAEVWLARRADGVFRREVALKLPLLARARRELEQRFARERDILANLEHPNIARLYDAGIDPDGLPYLSMEYIQGVQLTEWCDSQRLTIQSRLDLFVQVLQAVQYAHERHVIHRDLKPSNILVTAGGQACLLDFGVATLLGDPATSGHAPLTQVYGHAITPVYASPELVRGELVDVKSDIYSLGVVLYELLAGQRPYRVNAGASRNMLEQAIIAAEISRPSTQLSQDASSQRSTPQEQLYRQLRGDLDQIVLKALSKDPQGRYENAAAFAEDLRRYREGRPVIAQPPSLRYRATKFFRRHRTAVTAGVTAAVVLAAAAAYEIERASNDELLGLSAAPAGEFTRASIHPKSIAVLPFLDLSEKQDQGYFCDGLSEELITSLAQIQDLEVIARTSSFHFRGKQDAIQEIASALRVANVLEGSVRRSGDTLRITAQMVRTDTGAHVWSQTFDRDVKDIFKVQDEIAGAVVDALKLKLLPAPHRDLHRSDIPEAYNEFLLARQYGRRGNLEDSRRAVTGYTHATELDPGFAAAYAGLSFARTAIANATQDPNDFRTARAAADQALTLAPQLTDAYRARSINRMETLDFAGARADAEKAITLAPGESAVQSLYGSQMAAAGKLPQAITAMNRAIELDPLSGYAWANIGLLLTERRDYPEARRALDRAIAINSYNDSYHTALGQLDMLEGKLNEAQAEFQKQTTDGGRLMGAAMVEHARSRDRESQAALHDLISQHAADMAYQVGEVYAWRGEKDRAFEWLERAYQQRDSGLSGIAYDPLLVELRNDNRYQELLRKLRLVE